jgi:hypothetical protein
MRWCTEYLKIKPFEKWVGDDDVVSYVGIRADENRKGYVSTRPNIKAVFPFVEKGLVKKDILRILDESGIGRPPYMSWRSRSGCFVCLFQIKIEWVNLHDEHPHLFWRAVSYEEEHEDGRSYTWSQGETLRELIARRDEIEAEHARRVKRQLHGPKPNRPLATVLEGALEDEEDDERGSMFSIRHRNAHPTRNPNSLSLCFSPLRLCASAVLFDLVVT